MRDQLETLSETSFRKWIGHIEISMQTGRLFEDYS